MDKIKAATLFGGRQTQLAQAIGVTKQAISKWPDSLTTAQSDRVIGAAIRLRLIPSRHPVLVEHAKAS